jgi:prolipoprotein diacylglyceryltransferase
MVNELSLAALALAYGFLFAWAFRTLPQEGWQILASLPQEKLDNGAWTGLNFTYYGAFTASSVALAAALVTVLVGSLSVPLNLIGALATLLLGLCIPAAKWIARAVEAKPYTFTIGGASFVGLLAVPWLILLVNATIGQAVAYELPVVGTLAAASIAYAIGEGTGRLACISFGCCYGKPVQASAALLRHLFRNRHFAFAGATKKVAYEGALELVPVIPIQGITAVLFVAAALIGMALFLHGHFLAAFLETVLVTQTWRSISECFRADYRGQRMVGVYPIFALLSAGYALVVALLLPAPGVVQPNLLTGLQLLWHPGTILSLQAVWLLIFLYTGRSHVTTSTITFAVLKDRI